jgi:exosortase
MTLKDHQDYLKMKDAQAKHGSMYARHACFMVLVVAAIGVFHHALFFVMCSSLTVDRYSHILLVVPVSVLLVYLTRRRVFATVAYSPPAGILFLILLGAFACAGWYSISLTASGYISLWFFLFAICCLSAFTFSYGIRAFQAAAFPLLFLLLIVPLPDSLLEGAIAALQNGSAVVACWLFGAAHIPYVRHGIVLALPRINIYVAEECSGIRSSMVLLLCGLVLGHLYLKSFWSKVILTLAVFPLMAAKNGLRIFVLSTLGMYVDPSFLSGRLHHHGGFIFFGLAFVGLFGLIWCLQRFEPDVKGRKPETASVLKKVCDES